MPITSELQNTRELREVGFTQQQAEKLAELFERSQAQGFEKFAEVLQKELAEMRSEVRGEIAQLRGEIKDLRVELHASLRDQLLKMVGIMVGLLGLAVAIIKLFPSVQ